MDKPRVTNWDIYKGYLKQVRFHWFSGLLLVLGETIATISFSIITPLYYKKFFDIISTAQNPESGIVNFLFTIIFTILIINLIGSLCFRLSTFAQNYFQVKVGNRLVNQAFQYLIEHSHTFFINSFSGSLVKKINRYHISFARLVDKIVGDITPLIIKIVGIILILYHFKPIIAFIIIVWILAFTASTYILAKFKLKYDIITSEADSKMTAVIADSISNHNSVQLFTGTHNESALVGNASSDFYKKLLFRWNIGAVIDAGQSISLILVEFLIFYFGIRYWQLGTISVGTFVLIQAYIITISNSMWGFSRVVRDLYEATADAREMVEILHLPHEIQDVKSAKSLVVQSGAIEFKNVNFAFGKKKENNKPVFTKLNLSINPGEKVGIIGSSGAGKSTFVKLLLRLHDIQSGEILVDGQNIKNVTQDSLRENISLVPQDPALFHRTLMENIRYGKRDATDEEVINASKLAHCDIFIKDFPQKYETLVGERGIKLSGGERQRVAIARAILKNAPILVLDEATSSLDSHSEALIQDALHTLMEGKTTIVIAHRLSTIKKMDRIIVLGKDGIIEEGSHNDLIDKKGSYAKLWNLQAGGFGDKSIEELLES